MTFDLRRLTGLCVLVALAAAPLSACSSATKTTQTAGLDDSIQSLASGGVAVVENVTSQTPVVALTGTASAMTFTRWQVQNMVAEANAHSGYLGSELDDLAAPPAGAPSLSTLIVAWLTRHDGALAQYAASCMAGQDMKNSATTVFPTIVVLSFIGDIARMTPPATSQVRPPAVDIERLIAAPARADGVCTDVSNFVSSVVTKVTNAIQANGSGWLATFWNTVVTVAGAAVSVAVNNFLTPLLGFITKIATICATIMQVSSMFKPWSVTLAGNPSALTLSDTAQSGAFMATLNAKDIAWPAELVGCVQALAPNVKLDDASYKDAPVTWTQPINIPGLATKVSADDTLPDSKVAQYTYSTSTVPAVAANECATLVPAGKIGITVTVERSDITKTLTSLESLITSQIPASLATYLQPYIDMTLGKASTSAGEFGAPHQSSVVTLKQYVADPVPNCDQSSPSPLPSATLTPRNVSGSMPFEPCHALLNDADTVPFLAGAHVLPSGDVIDKLTGMMAGLTGIGGELPDTYDKTRISYCALGTGTAPPSLESQAPTDLKVAGFFYSEPRGTIPYPDLPPLPASAAGDPGSCTAIIGVDTLNRLGVRCVTGGPNGVVVDGPLAEYGMTGAAANSGSSGSIQFVLPPDGLMKAMAHLLQRL
jgi:hypothetical protein